MADSHRLAGLLVAMITLNCLCGGLPITEEPLLLTPYIEAGNLPAAVKACKVVDPCNDSNPKEDCGATIPESCAGFLTVNKALGNNLFFWYFPSQEQEFAPLLLWLNGGPGISSMKGLLWDNGPLQPRSFGHDISGKFEARNGSWLGPFSLLYIDNPVFTGYSYSSSGPRTTQEEYGDDLYEFLQQFYKLFPHLLSIDLYIGGVSYAGKYVPVLAHKVHTSLQKNQTDIPLRGIYLGGPLFAPEEMFPENFEYLYNVGAISGYDRVTGQMQTQIIVNKYLAGEMDPADAIRKIMPLIFKFKIPSYDNYVSGKDFDSATLEAIMMSKRIRRALHVGNLDYSSVNGKLFSQFLSDIMSSTKDKLGDLLNAGSYKVLIFSGDSDVIVSVAMVEAALLATPWSGRDDYRNSSRTMWYGQPTSGEKNGTLYGYYSHTGKLCRVVVRGAGHSTAHDQLARSREMMVQFVQNGCVGEKK